MTSISVKLTCSFCLLQDEAAINTLELEVLPPYTDITQVTFAGSPYFHAELPTGEQVYVKTKQHFPLQFGRCVCKYFTFQCLH